MLSHQIDNISVADDLSKINMGTRFHFNRVRVVWIVHLQRSKHHTAKINILISITYSLLHETLDNLGAQLLWWHVPWRIISLLDAVAARHYLQTSSIFCSATQDCFGSSCTVSIYMAQLIISSAKFTQLSTLLPHDFNQETPAKVDSSRARAIVVVPLRFPHRQNLCNRPPSAGEDSTTLHLTNCISR